MTVYEVIEELKNKLEELEKKVNQSLPSLPICCVMEELAYVDLSGTNEEKLTRMIKQLEEHKINIVPTPKDSQIVRSAIIAEFGIAGLSFWLRIRQLADNYEEQSQINKYNYLLSKRANNPMTFGIIVNRYKIAIDNYNNSLY